MKRRRHHKKGAHCKVVRVKGQGLRRLCWGRNGRLKSNTKAHR